MIFFARAGAIKVETLAEPCGPLLILTNLNGAPSESPLPRLRTKPISMRTDYFGCWSADAGNDVGGRSATLFKRKYVHELATQPVSDLGGSLLTHHYLVAWRALSYSLPFLLLFPNYGSIWPSSPGISACLLCQPYSGARSVS